MNRQAVENELRAAKEALRLAQDRYHKAVAEMDVIIIADSQAQRQRDAAADIKAFQKSEARRRELGL